MRLVCPNCGAVYEVPEDNIPVSGRDVQCSACEQKWFFERPIEEEITGPDSAQDDSTGASDNPDSQSMQGAHTDETVVVHSAFNATEKRNPTPPHVSAVLKEEAAREAAARAAEMQQTKTEDEPADILGDLETFLKDEALEDLSAKETGVQDQDAEPKDHATSAYQEPQLKEESRLTQDLQELEGIYIQATKEGGLSKSSLLPEIEKVNSSLGQQTFEDMPAFNGNLNASHDVSKAGQYGFLLGISLVVLAFMIYLYAEPIAGRFSVVDPYLFAYTTYVDGLRFSIDAGVNFIAQWMDTKTDGESLR